MTEQIPLPLPLDPDVAPHWRIYKVEIEADHGWHDNGRIELPPGKSRAAAHGQREAMENRTCRLQLLSKL